MPHAVPFDEASRRRMHRRRAVKGAAKLTLAVGILGVLVWNLRGDDVFTRLLHEPKQWGYLAGAQACILVAFSLSFVRWYLLVRALHLPFTLSDAFRLGSLGFMLNQVSLGSVGGDVFKAMFVAREQPGRRTEAVATVVIDRVVGLYAMLLVASAAAVFASELAAKHAVLVGLSRAVGICLLVGTVALVWLMTPWAAGPQVRRAVSRVPLVGGTLARLVDAAAAYRDHRRYLFAALAVACCTHSLLVTAFWLISHGLPVRPLDFGTTLLIGPMSLVAGAIPLTPSGLGVFETAFAQLFQTIGGTLGEGSMVAITYRAMTYVMAAVGATYYVLAHGRIAKEMHDAEQLADEMADEPSPP